MDATKDSSYSKHKKIDISLATNVIAFIILALGYIPSAISTELKAVGIFALSGALTNWLAIHMLFEKIPGLYGSGIIPKNFAPLKESIRSLMMKQFFAKNIIQKFYQKSEDNTLEKSLLEFVENLDYDLLFKKLLESIEASPLGGMLQMIGGSAIVEPMKPTFNEKIQSALKTTVKDSSFQDKLKEKIEQTIDFEQITKTINTTINKRLEELTPNMVKEMIHNMIKDHLGWLVIWGGVFGGIIGLISTIIP
jgi:uncharacterized membrane-anchored protein YjiN (DUF445 family)